MRQATSLQMCSRVLHGALHPWSHAHSSATPCLLAHLAAHTSPGHHQHHVSQQPCQSHASAWRAPSPWRGFAAGSHATAISSAPQPFPQSAQSLQSAATAPPVIISPYACRVVVVGWMGSKKRYLKKYSQLWQRSGEHEVLSLRTTVPQTLIRWRGVIRAGWDTDKVAKLHIENQAMPTIYHIFSTGGFIHAGTMWRWMDQVDDYVLRSDLLGEVAGIILDSAPARVNEDMASRAIASALLGQSAGQPAGPLAGPLQAGTKAALGLYLKSAGIRKREEEVYQSWEDLAPACPQLYLYSDSDPLVPARDVEDWMKSQAARGVDVYSHRFQGSGHCEHYRQHPHEYAFQISKFMSHALSSWEAPGSAVPKEDRQ